MSRPTSTDAAAYLAAIQRATGLPETNGHGPEPDGPRYPAFRALLDAPDDPPQWLAKDFLLHNEYQLIAGEGGSFKTTVWLSTMAAIAGGYSVLDGFPVAEPMPVLMVSGEDAGGVLKNRLQAVIKGHGWDPERIRPYLQFLALEDVCINDFGWQGHIEDTLDQSGATLLGLDPLTDLIDFDENDNSKARPVIQWFRRLGRGGVSTLLCHHYGKASEHKQGMARIRGASSWMNAARAIYTIEVKDGSRWLGCGKMSRATKPEARELRIEVESEADNRAVWTSAQVALAHPPNDWKMRDMRELTPGERTALTALDAFPDEHLSWSRWQKAAGMSDSGLTAVIKRLTGSGNVTRSETGKWRGKPQWGYQISPKGRNCLLNFSTSPNFSTQLREVDSLNFSTSHPPLGGEVREVVKLPLAEKIAELYGEKLHHDPDPPPRDSFDDFDDESP